MYPTAPLELGCIEFFIGILPPAYIDSLLVLEIGLSYRRWALLIFVGLFVVGLGISTVYRAAWDDIQRSDYTVYSAAGKAVLDGTDIYKAENVRGWRYVYPPPFALLVTPLANLPVALGAFIWYVLSVGSIFLAACMSVAMLGRPILDRHKVMLYGLPMLLLSVVLVSGIMRGQASEILIALIVATFYFHFKKRPWAAGVSLAAAVAMKVFPIALLGYFAIRRQWSVLISTLSSLVCITLLLPSLYWGWQQNLNYLHKWGSEIAFPATAGVKAAPNTPLYDQLIDAKKSRNQSIQTLFLTEDGNPELARNLSVIVAGIMLAVMSLVSLRVRTPQDDILLASAFVTWGLLIPPISETHYFGTLIFPLTVLLGYILYQSESTDHKKKLQIRIVTGTMIATMLLIGWRTTELLRPLCLTTIGLWVWLLYLVQSTSKSSDDVHLGSR